MCATRKSGTASCNMRLPEGEGVLCPFQFPAEIGRMIKASLAMRPLLRIVAHVACALPGRAIRVWRHDPPPRQYRRSATGATMPTPTPPYQFIAIARTIARGFAEQAIGHPEGETLNETAGAIWRGIEVLEGAERRKRPGEVRSMMPVRRALSAAPVPAR